MMAEMDILHKINHPHIMRVLEIMHTNQYYFVACELCEGGELMDCITEKGKFSQKDAASITKQTLLALNHMHSREKPLVHRDLKPQNILLESKDTDHYHIKLTDFGISAFYNKEDGLSKKMGTEDYMAPEILKKQKYDAKIDIWGVGMITCMLLTGEIPFKQGTRIQ